MIDKHGWLLSALRRESPNYGERPADCTIDLAVIHSISLPPGKFGGDDVALLFENRLDCNAHSFYDGLRDLCVSAHFFICRAGDITQFVSCQKRAWHAGESHWRGRVECNDFSIGIELEGTDDMPYMEEQYQTLAALLLTISATAENNSLPVVGHEHIAPGRKKDPGEKFDWEKLFNIIGKEHDGR